MFSKLEEKYGDDFNWGVTDNSGFLVEVTSELNNQHPLFDRIEKVIARCYSNDDVLFLLNNGNYVIVHLTYLKINTAGFPAYKEFSDICTALEFIEKQFVSDFL